MISPLEQLDPSDLSVDISTPDNSYAFQLRAARNSGNVVFVGGDSPNSPVDFAVYPKGSEQTGWYYMRWQVAMTAPQLNAALQPFADPRNQECYASTMDTVLQGSFKSLSLAYEAEDYHYFELHRDDGLQITWQSVSEDSALKRLVVSCPSSFRKGFDISKAVFGQTYPDAANGYPNLFDKILPLLALAETSVNQLTK